MPATPYNDTPVVDKPWDGPAAEAKLSNDDGQSVYEREYAWRNADGNADKKNAYKLPHHEVDSGGQPGAANVNGVRAALSRLGQPATGIPDSDTAAVKAHLQKHLDKFNAQTKSGLDLELGTMLETEGRIWAVRGEVMATLADLHARVISGEDIAIEAALRSRQKAQQRGNVAVVPLKGMITPHGGLLSLLFGGGGGLDQFSQDLRSAASNPDVHSIVLDIDSPGGLVDQVPETADVIRQARQSKPVVAVANTLAASAAYWLASQAHEVAVTPSGEAGSIGVYQLHRDLSGAHQRSGVKPTLISAGKYKVEGNPYEPLSDEAAGAMQQGVDDFYNMFVKDVADGRGVDPQQVAGGYGEGRVLTAKRAVSAGIADRVATLDQTISRLGSGRAKIRQFTDAEGQSRDRLVWDEQAAVPLHALSDEEKDRLLEVAGTAAVNS